MARPALSDAERSDVFRGLANPGRRQVLQALGRGEKSATQLLRGLGISMPALSQHLRVLSETGLVSHRALGTQRIYSINPAALRRAQRWLSQRL